jgi:hypothetical protein
MQQIEGKSYFYTPETRIEYTRYSPLLSYQEYLYRDFQKKCIDIIQESAKFILAESPLYYALRVQNLSLKLAVQFLERAQIEALWSVITSIFRQHSLFTVQSLFEVHKHFQPNQEIADIDSEAELLSQTNMGLNYKVKNWFSNYAYNSAFSFLNHHFPQHVPLSLKQEILEQFFKKNTVIFDALYFFVSTLLYSLTPNLISDFLNRLRDLIIDYSKQDASVPEHSIVMQALAQSLSHVPNSQLFKKLGWVSEESVTETTTTSSTQNELLTAIRSDQAAKHILTVNADKSLNEHQETYLATYTDLQNLGVLTNRIAGIFRYFQNINLSTLSDDGTKLFGYLTSKETNAPMFSFEIPVNYISADGKYKKLSEVGKYNDALVKQVAETLAAFDYLKIPMTFDDFLDSFIVSNDENEMRLLKLDCYDPKAVFQKPLKESFDFTSQRDRTLLTTTYDKKAKELHQNGWMYIGIDPYAAFKEMAFYAKRSYTIIASRIQATIG